ncbi:MAG TPA: porin family protein [Haliscomenobacter sp.]|uniref:porin family protein n=1 Tax=Haliscomenobacter sp. TaxID=2717303 RepID=UPI002CD8B5F0|nr:porin family protein [Haliscomenobacter sp.]HOY20702.1 porin family protein [Haliscomenobacter sp.]HPH20573.1 porin family protein [Haliscomenobacter sp.]
MKLRELKIAIFLGLGCIMLIPSLVSAQAAFGIRAGLNATNISFDNLDNRSERLGWHAGVFADLPILPEFISIQPELSYSVKGTKYKPLTEKKTLSFDYVDFLLPIAFKLGPVDLQVGPFASYLISDRDYIVIENNQVVTDAFKKFDGGLTAGISFNFNKVFLGIRYNQGFSDLTRDNVREFLGSGKNGVGQVSLGFKF